MNGTSDMYHYILYLYHCILCYYFTVADTKVIRFALKGMAV